MKFLLPILLLISVGWTAHPIHVSVCEINHNVKNENLEIIIRIFADDFEDVLEDRNGVRTRLGTDEELAVTNDYIIDYLQEKFVVEVNGSMETMELVGKELEDLAMICYLQIPGVKEVKSMTISNEVMVHWFDDQVNVTHIDCNDKLKSTFFSKGRTKESFEWK